MLLSYVLRLVPGALAEGRLAGTVHVVETGATTAFSSLDELLAALLPSPRSSAEGGPEPAGPAGTVDLRDRQRRHAPADRPSQR